jgi:hypothetical protein
LGVAVPADEECEQAADMSPERMQAAQYAQLRAQRGIHPDDFKAYDRGEMVGYTPEGEWIPGPNAQEIDLDRQMEDSELWYPKT